MLTFWSTDITILVLAGVIIMLQLALVATKKYSFVFKLKTRQLIYNQPYKTATIIILSYLAVNHLGIPTFNWVGRGTEASAINWGYIVEGVRLILVFYLVYYEEKALYLWINQFTVTHEVVVNVLNGIRNSLKALIGGVLLFYLLPEFIFFPKLEYYIRTGIDILIIWSVVWVVIQLIMAVESRYFRKKLNLALVDYHERGLFTQTKILKKIIIMVIIIIAIAATCLVFEDARIIGASILASAGIATGVLGFAANKIISNFFVGIQIALTKPIKINDIVKIGEDYGTVEDITLNYTIIRLWDLRRLIIPINYLLEKHFYNYSLNSTVITSVIIFFADYTIPVSEIRRHFIEIVQESKFWDRNSVALQVIDCDNRTLQLRGTASTANPSNSWDLKYEVLEKLAYLLANKYEAHLPKVRFEAKDQD